MPAATNIAPPPPRRFRGSVVRWFAGSAVGGFGGWRVRGFAGSRVRCSQPSVDRAGAGPARVAAGAAGTWRAHLARAALSVRREDGQPPLERRAAARRTLRRFSAADQQLELMSTTLAPVFVKRHRSIIAKGGTKGPPYLPPTASRAGRRIRASTCPTSWR